MPTSTRPSPSVGIDAPVRADRRHGRAAQGPPDDRRRGRAAPVARSHRISSWSWSGPPGWGQVDRIDRPFVRVARRTAVVGRRRAHPARSAACCIASRYEGFGLPALEALARGAPLAVAEGSALEEVVGDAALLFPAGDVEACTEALERLLEDEELRALLAARGRARAGELTWRHSAEAHAVAYANGGLAPGPARANAHGMSRSREPSAPVASAACGSSSMSPRSPSARSVPGATPWRWPPGSRRAPTSSCTS